MENSTCDGEIMEWSNSEMLTLQKKPDFPEFYIEKARLQSFNDWPKTLKQIPDQLSAAGFFYTQRDDRVICFCCGGGLHTWEEQDDPWEQHALHYGTCEYLEVVKGPEYVTSVQEKFNKMYSELCKTNSNDGYKPYFVKYGKFYNNEELIIKPIHEMDIDFVD